MVPLRIPPLRERKEDLLKFVHYFVNTFNAKFNKEFDTISDGARDMMLNYGWPGNIRELKNMIERVVLLESGNTIRSEMMPFSSSGTDESTVGRRVDSVLSQPIPDDGIDFDDLVMQLEREVIVKASEQSNWNQSRTARLLNMKRDKLRYRMKNFNLGTDETEVRTT